MKAGSLRAIANSVATVEIVSGSLAPPGNNGARRAGIAVVVARTGYTGENFGYELFAHPDRATAFWDAILAAGADLGEKPCGLVALDSTRTEAERPLHGHELAGRHAISPAAAGFGPYLKLHKPSSRQACASRRSREGRAHPEIRPPSPEAARDFSSLIFTFSSTLLARDFRSFEAPLALARVSFSEGLVCPV